MTIHAQLDTGYGCGAWICRPRTPDHPMNISARIRLIQGIRFALHVATLVCLLFSPFDGIALGVFAGSYLLSMLGVTMGYHRYFAHRAFKTSRAFQFLLALLAVSTLQRGVIWWSAVHRHHHRFSDEEDDYHSPRHGFWHAHYRWLDSPRVHQIDLASVSDLSGFAELRALDRFYYLPPLAWALSCVVAGAGLSQAHPELGPRALQFFTYGFLARTIAVWHATFAINSFVHRFGTRRFDTSDTSRNWWPLGLFGLGEGWHNNHHRFPTSARSGFYPREVDITYTLLRLLAALGLVWDLRPVPSRVLHEGRQRGQRADETAP